MLDVVKMKEACRICARELCGNQRRWIFHPAAKVNLQVLLSHVLGHELTRDGRGEFACSKCTFMLDRMYRFDTVIARVEALSLERLHKLLLEKDRLRQCIGGLYRRNNADSATDPSSVGAEAGSEDSPVVDLSALQDVRYSDMVQDDLAYSVYESWADKEDPALDHHGHQQHLLQCPAADSLSAQKPRRCRGCAALRVADSDYEAVCKVPRRIGRRSTSCGPSTRYSPAALGTEDTAKVSSVSEVAAVSFESGSSGLDTDKTVCDRMSPSPASSVESLDTAVDMSCPPVNHKDTEEPEPEPEKDPDHAPARRDTPWDKPPSEASLSGLEMMLSLLRGYEYRPVKPQQGSKLPVLVKSKLEQVLSLPVPLRSPSGGAADCEVFPQQPVPELVTPCPPQELQAELAEMEEQWLDDYVQVKPFCSQQRLIGEQQDRLSRYESAAGECVAELQEAQDQVHSLQAKIRESESRNQKLQERLADMELELRSAQDEAQRQERNIQNITDTVNTKETQAAELYQVIEEQNKMLCSLKELASRSQLQASGAETLRSQGEVLALQASLFQAQLELQAGQRAQRQAARTQEDLSRALRRLENDLQGALQHRRETERHNQDLQLALQKTRSVLQDREERLRDRELERRRQDEDRERTIRELKTSLLSKEQLIEDCELLEDPKEKRDSLLQKLRQRIRERDRVLERAVDEKFRCVEEKEEESRQLRLLLREKDRDLERQRCVLANNEETITSLELQVRAKSLELEQVRGGWTSVQRQQQDAEERQSRVLRERDAIISQLQVALHARTQEAQDLRCSLLAQIQSAPSDVLEDLKVRLHLKDRLFQEVLADRTCQAQEHQAQVQDLLRTISSRDQYIQDSANRLGEVMAEQTARLQELRRQLSSRTDCGSDSAEELQAVREELRLALRREKEMQEVSRSQAARVDSLARTLHVKDEIIRDFQMQLVEPSGLPLVERLTQEVQELRESLVQQGGPPARGPVLGRDRPSGRPPEFAELSSEDEDEADEDLNSECSESVDEAESKLSVQSVANAKGPAGPAKPPSQDLFEGQGLTEVKQLVEQKIVVERELVELKAQLGKAGFSSLSQMRKALFSLQAENRDLKNQLTEGLQPDRKQSDEQKVLDEEEEDEEEEEEEELDVTIEGVEEDEEEGEGFELWDTWDGDESLSQTNSKKTNRPESVHLLTSSSQAGLDCELSANQHQKKADLQLKSKELRERLMVSEATVQAQAEQLKDYRDLLAETAVQQDSKQIQVDLQDLGYETCGRSENEAEREDMSSPEFDDLEMCTSLDCGSQWWPASGSSSTFAKASTQCSAYRDESSLQRLVEDLRSQLSRSQAVIRGLQSRLRSLSTSSDYGPSTPRKVNWSFQASPSQSGTEDDEGWQSSDGGPLASPHHHHSNKGLQELASRVDALEDQLRKGGTKSASEDRKSATCPGKFDTLIQAQARELSHLRQRLREGRGVANILTQHLGDTTKAFEELLRDNDIDYYMGQSFREQLAQSSSLAQRVCVKISGRDHPEDPEEKTELLAIRLSKELQQKDKVIESLRAKLNQHHHHHPQRSDTPCSSHALSDTTDQSDRISYVSDEHGSATEDVELCSDVDPASEIVLKETGSRLSTDLQSHSGTVSRHPSVPPSISSSHGAHSWLSCPSMQCSSSPHTPADMQSQTAPASGFTSAPFHPPPSSSTSTQREPLPFSPHPSTLRTRYQGSGRVGFSLAEVHQELQMLQRQLGGSDRFSAPQSKPLQGFPFAHQQPDSPAFLPLSYQGYQPSPFSSTTSSSLDASSGMKAGANLLESSALWDMTYGTRPVRLGADLSSGSSGYQSGTSHTGSELMKEHLREIRSLRQRLEDSIQTNDRLRQQLEERLARTASEKGAPTNIYIQGLDSVGQLSGEIRFLKEENVSLQSQLRQATREGSKEVERLKEAALLERARLKEAELEAERWAEQSRKLQTDAEARNQEITQLKQDRQRKEEAINRLQHEVSVLQQQLSESRSLVQSLQCELQVYHGVCGATADAHSGQSGDAVQLDGSAATFDPRELRSQLEQQLSGRAETQPRARRQLFSDNVPSPPVRDTGLVSPSSPLRPAQKHAEDAAAVRRASALRGRVPDGSFADRHGHHAVGHIDDLKALQQQILEGSALLRRMEATLYPLSTPQESSLRQPSDSGSVRKLLSDTKTLQQILDEADSLLRRFWRAALPNCMETKQEESLRQEVTSLHLSLSEKEQALKEAMERLKSSNRTKDSMERFIVSQLSRTQDVLRKAKTNLQVKTQEASLSSPSLLVGVS